MLDDGVKHAKLAGLALWHDAQTEWSDKYWAYFQHQLLAEDARAEGWQVWIDWYQDRLDGDWIKPWSKELERNFFLIDPEIWKQGTAAVNARIGEMVKSHSQSKAAGPSWSLDNLVKYFANWPPPDFPGSSEGEGGRTPPVSGNAEKSASNEGPAERKRTERTAPAASTADAPASQTSKSKPEKQANPGNSNRPARARVRATAPPTVAFFSYTRHDDKIMDGLLSLIRLKLEDTLSLYHHDDVQVFQDTADIEGGDDWRKRLEQALVEATIFVPMITPRFFKSQHCREELQRFMARDDAPTFVVPVHFIDVDMESLAQDDDLAADVEALQWLDWRNGCRPTRLRRTCRGTCTLLPA